MGKRCKKLWRPAPFCLVWCLKEEQNQSIFKGLKGSPLLMKDSFLNPCLLCLTSWYVLLTMLLIQISLIVQLELRALHRQWEICFLNVYFLGVINCRGNAAYLNFTGNLGRGLLMLSVNSCCTWILIHISSLSKNKCFPINKSLLFVQLLVRCSQCCELISFTSIFCIE